MRELLGQDLKNVVYFKEESVRFNENRITFVRGLNLDSDPAQPTGNGAGKSLVMSCPANTYYFSPPLALKKKSKKQLLGKGSCITQHIKDLDGSVYSIAQYANKYTILKDGVDMELRTVPIAEAFIRDKLFPLSESLFYTTCYVSTQRQYAMQSSSDADRLQLLTEMFDLDDYDRLKRFFLDKISELRESEIRLKELERDLLDVQASLKKLKRKASADEGSIRELKKQRSELEKRIDLYVNKEFSGRKVIKDLKTLLSVEKELDTLRSEYTSTKKPEDYRSQLIAERKVVRAYETYEKLVGAYKRSSREAKEKLDGIKTPDDDAKTLRKRLKKFEERLESLTEEQDKLRRDKRAHAELESAVAECVSELKELGFTPKKAPDMKADYRDEIAQCRTTLKLRKLVDEHSDHDGTCPTCMSDIDVKNIKRLVKTAQKRLPELEAAVEAQTVMKSYIKANEKLKDSSFDADRLAEVESSIKKAKPAIEEVRAGLKTWDRHDTYKKVLDSLEKPKRPENEPTLGMKLGAIDDAIELCSDIVKHLAARQTLVESSDELAGVRKASQVKQLIELAEEELDKDVKHLSALRSSQAKIVTELDEASSAAHEYEVYAKRRSKLNARIEELRPTLEDKPILEVLVKAYSAKGLKTIVANDICSLLEQNLNTYANSIFTEPFHFTAQVVGGGLSIIVDRRNGVVSDVRQLSGAESNAFRLLFIQSILPLLPAHKRINMLTLDEPCAHMDEVFRHKFLKVFLPSLSELVPNLFIITPNADDYCEGSQSWIVRKENGVSTIIKDAMEFGSISSIAEAVATARKAVKKAKKTTKRQPRKGAR